MTAKLETRKYAPPLSAVRDILFPTFNRIFETCQSSNENESKDLDIDTYVQVHTVCYDYLHKSPEPSGRCDADARGKGLYQLIDQCFKDKANELASSRNVHSNLDTIKHILQKFHIYQACTKTICRMTNYIDRFYVLRKIDEGHGWLKKSRIDKEYDAAQAEELKKWGYTYDSGSTASKESALASAQASSAIDAIVPIQMLAFRRFRTEVVEPIFIGPKDMREWVKADIIDELEDSSDDMRQISREFREMLKCVGVLESRFEDSLF